MDTLSVTRFHEEYGMRYFLEEGISLLVYEFADEGFSDPTTNGDFLFWSNIRAWQNHLNFDENNGCNKVHFFCAPFPQFTFRHDATIIPTTDVAVPRSLHWHIATELPSYEDRRIVDVFVRYPVTLNPFFMGAQSNAVLCGRDNHGDADLLDVMRLLQAKADSKDPSFGKEMAYEIVTHRDSFPSRFFVDLWRREQDRMKQCAFEACLSIYRDLVYRLGYSSHQLKTLLPSWPTQQSK